MCEVAYIARWTVGGRKVSDPKVQSAGEVIFALVAATVCDVNSSILAGHGFIGPPFALGHECVARVTDVGDHVTGMPLATWS